VKRIITSLLILTALSLSSSFAFADEDDFSINGYMSSQVGLFQPLFSSEFEDYENEAHPASNIKDQLNYNRECDPVAESNTCTAVDHGDKGGTMSMFRNTIQLELDWYLRDYLTLHAVFRGVRSSTTYADKHVLIPDESGTDDVPGWVRDNYYTENDLREFYLDIDQTSWLSFRIGRQQVTWGETGSYRLLDAVNPSDTSWHFGPMESFRDTRIPLWMFKGLIDMPSIDHNFEFLVVPMLDGEKLVTVPLTFVGAWGLPISNTPSPYLWDNKYLETNWGADESRFGFRLKGNISTASTYSLVWYHTHQITPPIPHYFIVKTQDYNGVPIVTQHADMYLHFPRVQIMGGTLDYAFDNPIGAVLKFEGSYEPKRHFPRQAGSRFMKLDTTYGNGSQRFVFEEATKEAWNGALVLMRPTMIRFLNPTQNFLLMGQVMYTWIPNWKEEEREDLVAIPGFSDYKQSEKSFRLIGVAGTSYMHGAIAPRFIAGWFGKSDGFVLFNLNMRTGDHWRIRFQAIDFYGKHPYESLGLFRDRDELNLKLTYQF
jgi:Protein of unknown function (DUF1302)